MTTATALCAALEALGRPSDEHIQATRVIQLAAHETWQRLEAERIELAGRIADAAAFHGEIDPDVLEAYRTLHGEQVAARTRRTVAADELERAIKATR